MQNHSTALLLIRDCYESIVLTSFFYLLLNYISHDTEEQKENTAEPAGITVRTSSDSNDAIILIYMMTKLSRDTADDRTDNRKRTWAKIDNGVTVNNAEKNPPRPSLCNSASQTHLLGQDNEHHFTRTPP